jgi:hypothetical protein
MEPDFRQHTGPQSMLPLHRSQSLNGEEPKHPVEIDQ